jgi:hypothetical protein
MAFDDRPKLPRVTVRDEKLYVEGEKEPYFQDRKHTIRLCVRALTIYRGYVPENFSERAGAKVPTESLRGTATLEDGNRFALIGLETDRKTPINFVLPTIADNETKHHWQASIGFTPPMTGSTLIGRSNFGSRDTAGNNISMTCSQRFGEATSTTSASAWKRRCGRKTTQRSTALARGPGTLHRQSTATMQKITHSDTATSRR